ncbi:MAG: tRNA uridine-5-carboxymethylaminomethyl(34) synthesis GTPase MnmE [Deltaproteobacteria bacterium]|jgi:tRNA modification GTPase|nr:tRNA uridine-5-carboxymethylaminomethyl(34) synthesis GTPase MnmE [Deltaproteobacteria bacterium]
MPPALDTIAATATAAGQGGIGIIRLSGSGSRTLLERVFQPLSPRFAGLRPWTLHRGRILALSGEILDEALVVFMPGPRSFTGEDVAELHCHGSPALLALVLENLCAAGARLAERGEFTRRAFLNGRMDLTQAEAVAELIAAPGPEAARWANARLEGHFSRCIRDLREHIDCLRAQISLAVDFPDDEVDADLTPQGFLALSDGILAAIRELIAAHERTRPWREGMILALAGPVNSGKSSLFNVLLGRERALVSATPGTTRDYLEESIRFAGLPMRLVDTAGLRPGASDAADRLEAEGIRLGRRVMDQADLIVLLIDGGQPDPELCAALLAELGSHRVVLAWNKLDLNPPAAWLDAPPFALAPRVALCATRGQGLEALEHAVRSLVHAQNTTAEAENALVPNLRQTEALRRAAAELEALRADVSDAVPWDLCAVRLDSVAAMLGDVTGISTPDEVLNRIFAAFCIGK